MPEVSISQDDGLWTVYTPSLVVTDLSREDAEAFAAAYRRLRAAAGR